MATSAYISPVEHVYEDRAQPPARSDRIPPLHSIDFASAARHSPKSQTLPGRLAPLSSGRGPHHQSLPTKFLEKPGTDRSDTSLYLPPLEQLPPQILYSSPSQPSTLRSHQGSSPTAFTGMADHGSRSTHQRRGQPRSDSPVSGRGVVDDISDPSNTRRSSSSIPSRPPPHLPSQPPGSAYYSSTPTDYIRSSPSPTPLYVTPSFPTHQFRPTINHHQFYQGHHYTISPAPQPPFHPAYAFNSDPAYMGGMPSPSADMNMMAVYGQGLFTPYMSSPAMSPDSSMTSSGMSTSPSASNSGQSGYPPSNSATTPGLPSHHPISHPTYAPPHQARSRPQPNSATTYSNTPYPYHPQSYPYSQSSPSPQAPPRGYSQFPPRAFGSQFSPGPPGATDWWYVPQQNPSQMSSGYDYGSGGFGYSSDSALAASLMTHPTQQVGYPNEGQPSSRDPRPPMPIRQRSFRGNTAGPSGPEPSSRSENPSSTRDSNSAASASTSHARGSLGTSRPAQTLKAIDHASVKGRAREKSPFRKPYHPNPAVNRSEWVMWVGNVPSDATQEELLGFFTTDDPPITHTDDNVSQPAGVSSVFLIPQSNCAFVNYDTEEHLQKAVVAFNGKSLRPHDGRHAKLVCRIRRKDDDLRAGVGAQRGVGMHSKWIKNYLVDGRSSDSKPQDLSEAGSDPQLTTFQSQYLPHDDPPTSPSTHLGSSSASNETHHSPPKVKHEHEDHHPEHRTTGESSGSFASTTSSLLRKYFPHRFFIMKSLSEADLLLSVERGVWATQPHNEPILDQAFRTSKDVYLIFGANKTGEFFGYARMSGPISLNEKRLSWTSRTDSGSIPSLGSSKGKSGGHEHRTEYEILGGPVPTVSSDQSASPSGNRTKYPHIISQQFAASPSQMTGSSVEAPASLSPGHPPLMESLPPRSDAGKGNSAPAMFGGRQQPPSKLEILPNAKTIDVRPPSEDVRLDPLGPIRAMRDPVAQRMAVEEAVTAADLERREADPGSSLVAAVRHAEGLATTNPQDGKETWGTPFAVQWIKTTHLPFHRTRHLRNVWNSDKEVKVSRDGTEIEPSVGEALLREWDRLETSPPTTPLRPTAQVRSSRGGSSTRPRSKSKGNRPSSDIHTTRT